MERFFRLLDFKTFIDKLKELIPEIEVEGISEFYCDFHVKSKSYKTNLMMRRECIYQDDIDENTKFVLSIYQDRKPGDLLILDANDFDKINYNIVSDFIKRGTFYDKFDIITKDLYSLENKGIIISPERKVFIMNPEKEMIVRFEMLILNYKRDITGKIYLCINLDTEGFSIFSDTKGCLVSNIKLENIHRTIIDTVNYIIAQCLNNGDGNYFRN